MMLIIEFNTPVAFSNHNHSENLNCLDKTSQEEDRKIFLCYAYPLIFFPRHMKWEIFIGFVL